MKILIILGPTATGKTDVALDLAKKMDGEIIACDSRQVYRGLDIGTGKAPSGIFNFQRSQDRKLCLFSIFKRKRSWVISGVRIWMYDVADPRKQYDVARYIDDADRVITNILKRDKIPIIVGGTGLYLKGFLEGFSNLKFDVNLKLRKSLEKIPLTDLQKKLEKISPNKWNNMNNSDKNNPRRLIRAIELSSAKKTTKSSGILSTKHNILKIGLTAQRDFLNKKIDTRVLSRIDQGMIEEAERLHENGLSLKRMRELGLEYGILADYLEKKIGKNELIKIMQTKIHQYAKRQITWFKKERDVHWFDISEDSWREKIEKLAQDWYNS